MCGVFYFKIQKFKDKSRSNELIVLGLIKKVMIVISNSMRPLIFFNKVRKLFLYKKRHDLIIY